MQFPQYVLSGAGRGGVLVAVQPHVRQFGHLLQIQVLSGIGGIFRTDGEKAAGLFPVFSLHCREPQPFCQQAAVENAEIVGSIEHRYLQFLCGTATVPAGNGAAAVQQIGLEFFQKRHQLFIGGMVPANGSRTV